MHTLWSLSWLEIVDFDANATSRNQQHQQK